MTHALTAGGAVADGLADAAPAALESRVLPIAALGAGEVAMWNALCATHADLANPFLTHAYARACADIFHAVRVCVLRRGGEPVGFFPFQFRSPVHRLLGLGERLGGELSDYFGIAAELGAPLAPADLLRASGLNALFFTHLDETQGAFGLHGEQPEPGLRIRMGSGGSYWEELRQSDRRFVNDTERRERKLAAAEGALRFVFREPDPLPHLEFLLARKRDQYKRTGVADPLASASAQALLRRLALSDDSLCRGVVSTLYAGDTWVASHFGLTGGGTLHYWFPVYNPDLHAFSPGRLLLKAVIQSAPDLGITLIDRGAGDTQAKRDLANERHTFTRGLWANGTPPAVAFRAALGLGWRLEKLRAEARKAPPGRQPDTTPEPPTTRTPSP